MAISTSLVPISSSSHSIFSSLLGLCPLKVNRNKAMNYRHTNGRFVINCSSSEVGPINDSTNLRQSQLSSMTPLGVTMNDAGMSKPSCKWQRVLLKVSGEALTGYHTHNIDPKIMMAIAREVASVTQLGIEVAIVVGGGNIFRVSSWVGSGGLDHSSVDYIGMLATVMNVIFLQVTMESIGIPTRPQTAFRMSEVAEPYIRRRAIRHLEKGRVLIFAAKNSFSLG